MTSNNLAEIIEKYGLYREESKTEPREVLIELMREDVAREMISAEVVDPRSGRPTEATIAFRLSFDSESPQLAQRVTNELVSLYLNENIKTRTESVAQTVTFLEEEANRLGRRVKELEQEMAEFKRQNAGSLPELEEVTRAAMNRIDLEIAEIDRRSHAATQQKIYLEGELGQLEPFRLTGGRGGESPSERLEAAVASLTLAESSYAEGHPDVTRLRKQVEALRDEVDPAASRTIYENQLTEARTVLNERLAKYGDEHPSLISARRAVKNLETKLDTLPETTEQQPLNPAYMAMKARLEAVNAEIRSLTEKRIALISKNEQALRNLAQMPEAEAQYRGIFREYENTVAKYREVAAKQMEARLSQNLETERKGERFVLIEPPLLPQEPAKPNRLAIALIGIVLALGGGLGAVGLADATDTKVRGRRGIQDLLTAPPLAAIPFVPVPGEERGRRSVLKLGTIALVLLIAALAIIHFAVKPLDVLWYVVLRKGGF